MSLCFVLKLSCWSITDHSIWPLSMLRRPVGHVLEPWFRWTGRRAFSANMKLTQRRKEFEEKAYPRPQLVFCCLLLVLLWFFLISVNYFVILVVVVVVVVVVVLLEGRQDLIFCQFFGNSTKLDLVLKFRSANGCVTRGEGGATMTEIRTWGCDFLSNKLHQQQAKDPLTISWVFNKTSTVHHWGSKSLWTPYIYIYSYTPVIYTCLLGKSTNFQPAGLSDNMLKTSSMYDGFDVDIDLGISQLLRDPTKAGQLFYYKINQ